MPNAVFPHLYTVCDQAPQKPGKSHFSFACNDPACRPPLPPLAVLALVLQHDIVQREGVHMGRVLHVPLEPRFSPYETLPSSLNSTSSALTSLIAPFDAMFKLWNVVEQITTECPVANVQSLERSKSSLRASCLTVFGKRNGQTRQDRCL
jgi:hypothetical protein